MEASKFPVRWHREIAITSEPWSTRGMSLPKTPALGVPVPQDRHAISVQLPTWDDMVSLGCHHTRITDVQEGGYPRSFLHRDVIKLSDMCRTERREHLKTYLLFPTPEYAQACVDFSTSHCDSGTLDDQQKCNITAFGFRKPCLATEPDIYLYAATLPDTLREQGLIFWRLTGLGISSRLAERCLTLQLRRLPTLYEHTKVPQYACGRWHNGTKAHEKVRSRLADLYNRTNPRSTFRVPVTRSDIYLYPTGMAAIYHIHQLLLKWRGTKTVVFGFPYELTLKLIQSYGPAWDFWGFGSDEELDHFEASLELPGAESQVQAVWCECASNPLLRTVDLARIHRLAEKYDFVVVVDDTIGSVANIDVLDVADIVVTSLTKSFSGYANVMAGSATLSPRSPHHSMLRAKMTEHYENLLFVEDAIQLEVNSRDYLQRSAQANNTASALAHAMKTWSTKSGGPFSRIYYPETCWSQGNYSQRMRPATAEYTPGFGSLLTIELVDVDIAAVFFDALPVHKGPSLGAQYTLAQPYVQTVFQKEKEWAARYGLKESIVRVSIGLEDRESLISAFASAARIADETYRRRNRNARVHS